MHGKKFLETLGWMEVSFYLAPMMNETQTPNTMYKVSTITTERGFTMDGRTFTTIADVANIAEGVLTFPTIAEAVAAARDYAEARGFKYLEIGDISTPALGETFVEIRTA